MLFSKERTSVFESPANHGLNLTIMGTGMSLDFFNSPITRLRKLVFPSLYCPIMAMIAGFSKRIEETTLVTIP